MNNSVENPVTRMSGGTGQGFSAHPVRSRVIHGIERQYAQSLSWLQQSIRLQLDGHFTNLSLEPERWLVEWSLEDVANSSRIMQTPSWFAPVLLTVELKHKMRQNE
jgi:hypothetical protein